MLSIEMAIGLELIKESEILFKDSGLFQFVLA